MRSILTSKWLKAAVFALCLVPLAHLAWQAWHGDLGANPIEFVTHALGDWTLIFIVLTLSVTPARRILRQPELIRFRRMDKAVLVTTAERTFADRMFGLAELATTSNESRKAVRLYGDFHECSRQDNNHPTRHRQLRYRVHFRQTCRRAAAVCSSAG